MTKQEEKQWLRAILEGRVKPGDEEWKQVREGDDFEGVRRSIRKRAGLHLENREDDLEVMWQTIESRLQQDCVYKNNKQHRRLLVWTSWAAVVVLLICLPILYGRREKKEQQPIFTTASLAKQEIVLVMPNGERKTLDDQNEQVVVNEDGGMKTNDRTLIVESDNQNDKEPQYYTLDVPKGAEYSLVLADGTKVFLNAGTTLSYPDRFVGKNREITLSGEAYLVVAKDAKHPFIVNAGDVKIQVLGTVFNVNAYPEGEWVRTTLVEGKVQTECNNQNITMEPGTQVAYNRMSQIVDYRPVNVDLYTSWIEGYYDFEEMELGELMQTISRWYDIPIDFESADLKRIKFSGRLQRYNSVEQLFKMLEYTQDVDFDITKYRITIRSK